MPKEGVKKISEKEEDMINDMISSFSEKGSEKTDALPTEAVAGESEEQEAKKVAGEEPQGNGEASEGDGEAGEVEGSTENKDDKKGDENKEEDEVTRLRKTVEELSAQKPQLGEEPPEEEEPKGEKKGEQPTKAAVEDHFSVDLTDDEYDEIMSSKKKFAEFLMKFGGQIRQQSREDALRDIPSVVQKTTSRQQALLEKRRQFYEDNPDLKQHKGYVGYAANQIYSDNPDLSADELFAKTAERVRKDLALNKQAVEQENDRLETQTNKKKQPAFTQGTKGSRSTPGDTRDELQKDLDAMLTGR